MTGRSTRSTRRRAPPRGSRTSSPRAFRAARRVIGDYRGRRRRRRLPAPARSQRRQPGRTRRDRRRRRGFATASQRRRDRLAKRRGQPDQRFGENRRHARRVAPLASWRTTPASPRMPTMLPTLVIVGRPNVGKSTLFNRLTQSRAALVADYPGLTRDRHYGRGLGGDRPYLVVDTGGFEPKANVGHHARDGQADAAPRSRKRTSVIFLVDGREGLTPQDKIIADLLRRSGRPLLLAVNKAEGLAAERVTAEFHELALGDAVADLVRARRERPRPGRHRAGAVSGGRRPTEPERRRGRCAAHQGRDRRAARMSASRR